MQLPSLLSVFRPTSSVTMMASMTMLITVAQLIGAMSQQTIDEDSAPGLNNDAAFVNYNQIRENGQAFFFLEGTNLFETPGSPKVEFNSLVMSNDLEFTSDGNGYVGRGLLVFLEGWEDLIANGATLQNEGVVIDPRPITLSAVYVPKLGLFEGMWQSTNDDHVFRFWDEGKPTITSMGWESHDAGDTSVNANKQAFTSVVIMTPILAEEAAKYLGVDVTNLTAETFTDMYEDAWNKMDTKSISDSNDDNGACETIEEMIKSNPTLSHFSDLFDIATSAEEYYTDADTWTVFAPTDDAFDDSGIVVDDLSDYTAIRLFLFHEVKDKVLTSADLICKAGENLIEMGSGQSTRTNCNKYDHPEGQKGGGNVDPADFVGVDMKGCNGVLHIIDKVLLPPKAAKWYTTLDLP